MAELRELQRKLESIQALQDVVHAMRSLAAVYVRRAEMTLDATRPYGQVVNTALRLAAGDMLMDIPVEHIAEFESAFREAVRDRLGDLLGRVREGGELSDEDVASVESLAAQVKEPFVEPQAEES